MTRHAGSRGLRMNCEWWEREIPGTGRRRSGVMIVIDLLYRKFPEAGDRPPIVSRLGDYAAIKNRCL